MAKKIDMVCPLGRAEDSQSGGHGFESQRLLLMEKVVRKSIKKEENKCNLVSGIPQRRTKDPT